MKTFQHLAAGALACAALCSLAGCGSKAPIILTFTVAPTEIKSGETATLSWNVDGAESLAIDQGVGAVTGKTSTTVSPSDSVTYTLTATSGGGTVTKTVSVSVLPAVPPTKILSFAATPGQIAPGTTTTLRWEVTGSPTLTIDNGVTVPATGRSVQVSPSATTLYTLSAKGPSDPAPVTATARVLVTPAPTIASFSIKAGQPAPALGNALAVEWVSTGDTFTLGDGTTTTSLATLHGASVRPLSSSTTYTLTAIGVTGQTTKTLVVSATGTTGTSLAYTDPPASSTGVSLVRDAASTEAVLVLNVRLNQALTALTGFALNLPLDGAAAGSRDGVVRVAIDDGAAPSLPANFHTVVPGLDVGPAIPVWSAAQTAAHPAAAMLALPTSGPLFGVLAAGFALKPAAACTANAVTNCLGTSPTNGSGGVGTVLARIRLKLAPGAPAGTVFTGTSGSGFRAELRDATAGVVTAFAVGTLSVQ